jgi:hypothetical protein
MSQVAPLHPEAQAPQAPQLSTLQQYEVQLNMFKQQKEAAKVQFHQLEGAIFALEQMIHTHKQSLEQSVEKLAKDAANSLKPNENQGEINDGKVDDQAKKQATQK